MGGSQVHYLSASPASLAEVLLTGGIPPNIDEPCSADSAYTRLFRWARPAPDSGDCMATDGGHAGAERLPSPPQARVHERRWRLGDFPRRFVSEVELEDRRCS